ncbi:MAG: metalloregulator ArsR/SmtB family transcription factor [Candidatus Korobacteraceae bacterium]|jgi:ArsR family transcriptional regulator
MKAADDGLSLKLRAISDPVRREILRLLARKGLCSLDRAAGMCAADLQRHLGLAQPTISHHMRVLAEAGLVQAEKAGTWVCYCRDDVALRRLAGEVRGELEQKSSGHEPKESDRSD